MNGLLSSSRSLSLFILLFVETSYVYVAVSGDELNVPYVPYVVVDKNKDEFDYDRLQDDILGYLNRRHSEASTTLYDFLRTSLEPAVTPATSVADVRSMSVSSPSSSYYTVGYPINPAHPSSPSYPAYSVNSASPSHPANSVHSASSNYPVNSVYSASPSHPANSVYSASSNYPANSVHSANSNYPGNSVYSASSNYPANSVHSASSSYPANLIHSASSSYPANSIHPASPSYPSYPASIYKSRKENPLVTARVRVTTYQPHKYSTPLDNSVREYTQRDVNPPVRTQQLAHHIPFIRVKDNGFTPIAATSTTTNSPIYITTPVDVKPSPKFLYGSEMKCSLRSSRYVYDGDCVSRKPVVETVCAERCIRYDYKKSKKPYFLDDSKTNSLTTSETKKQVVALTCSDGEVKKQKVKLYCKDGTIINNVIRIVQNCICNEHSEKVHATKRNQKTPTEAKTKMVYSMPHPSHPRIRSRPKF